MNIDGTNTLACIWFNLSLSLFLTFCLAPVSVGCSLHRALEISHCVSRIDSDTSSASKINPLPHMYVVKDLVPVNANTHLHSHLSGSDQLLRAIQEHRPVFAHEEQACRWKGVQANHQRPQEIGLRLAPLFFWFLHIYLNVRRKGCRLRNRNSLHLLFLLIFRTECTSACCVRAAAHPVQATGGTATSILVLPP